MAKEKKSVFFCKECGYESAKWMGQCPACREWNTFVEEVVSNNRKNTKISMDFNSKPQRLSEVLLVEEDKVTTIILKLDRV